MTNYRVNKVLTVTTGSQDAPANAWGVMRGVSGAGTINLLGSGSISIADLAVGQPFPCYVDSVTVSGGTVYILS